jgi:hypothetical protein
MRPETARIAPPSRAAPPPFGKDPPRMVSTSLTNRLFATFVDRSLAQAEANPTVARDARYYRENIGKVRSVDEFLGDNRLYVYAMRAHGLTDMLDAKALIREVLESDLNDENSVARRLGEPRLVAFAASFSFKTDGSVKGELPDIQADYQEENTIGLYSEHRVRQGNAAAADAQYYREQIAGLESVDDLIADSRLFAYALTAFGIDAETADMAQIRAVLLSDLSDPGSPANQLGERYVALASAFDFEADGTVPPGGAQSAAGADDTVLRYYDITGNGTTRQAAALRSDYYTATIAGVTDVDDFLADNRMFGLALTAFGLEPAGNSKEVIRAVLTSDLSDPASFANRLGDRRYTALAGAFNFKTDGSLDGIAQTPEQLETTLAQYFVRFDDVAEMTDELATRIYQSRINTIVTADGLIADKQLYDYVLTAFDFDPAEESPATIKAVLTSDLDDPNSTANRLEDPRYRALAAAFNFSANGMIATPRLAQVSAAAAATVALYNSRAGAAPEQQAAAQAESTYYMSAIGKVESVDELIADPRLVSYLATAYGLTAEPLSADLLRNVLTSDPFDRNSFVGRLTNKGFRDLAAAFNFNADGSIARAPEAQAQTRGEIIRVADLYLRAAVQATAAGGNPRLPLSLYFSRKAQIIDSPFDILSDRALFDVTRTALGLPDTMADASTDAQAAILNRLLNFGDFRDPETVQQFLTQFTNPTAVRSSTGLPSLAAILEGTTSGRAGRATIGSLLTPGL